MISVGRPEAKLQAKVAARERTLRTSHPKIADLERALQAEDEVITGLRRLAEISGAMHAALLERIDTLKQAEAVRQRREYYDAVVKRRARVAAMIAPALDKMTAIARPLMRELAEAELAVLRANENLPPDCDPLTSVETSRRVRNPESSARELRRGMFYVEENSGRVLGPEGQLAATTRNDGKTFDVIVPGGAASGGRSTIASLHEFVEAEVTQYPAASLPEQLALALRIPAMTLADPPGWELLTYGTPAFPDQILARLDDLEHHVTAEPPQPRDSVKLVPAERWDAEHAPAKQKAA
jgi:hypothetical protein